MGLGDKKKGRDGKSRSVRREIASRAVSTRSTTSMDMVHLIYQASEAENHHTTPVQIAITALRRAMFSWLPECGSYFILSKEMTRNLRSG